jgi:hypothetical protein
MDPRSRPLSQPRRPSSAAASAPSYPLADLPVEAPLDALPAGEPVAGGRAGTATGGAASAGEATPGAAPLPGTAEELVDPERLLLASEHAAPPIARAPVAAAPAATPPPAPASAAPASSVTTPVPPPAPMPSVSAAPPAQAAAPPPPPAAPAAPSAPAAASAELMDRDFIARNQVVERYLSGRLPIKGATDFERFCRDHPEILDELGIPERVNAALRLLEAGGKPEPWAEPAKPFWQKPSVILGLLAATLVLALALALVASGSAQKSRRIAALQQQATQRPLLPAASTRDIRLLPSRDGASDTPAIVIGGGSEGQLADFRIDESRSPYRLFRVTVDRINQGRVAIIDHLAKDSDGNLRIALNSTALGPGDYQLTIDGLTWQGLPQPDSWVTIGIRAPQ